MMTIWIFSFFSFFEYCLQELLNYSLMMAQIYLPKILIEGLDSLYEVPQKKVDSIFEENSKEFKSLIFEGEDHDAPFFGGRIDSVLNYLMN